MKLQWIAATHLSLLRQIRLAGQLPESLASPLPKLGNQPPELVQTLRASAASISSRLASDSVDEDEFWDHLVDEMLDQDDDTAITSQLCEIALLRSGGSQLQSDQAATSLFRAIELSKHQSQKSSPRLAEQLTLRYAPMKQAYEAFGPGMLRDLAHTIWSGPPPKQWWPKHATIHAVQPIIGGAAARSEQRSSLWIEAVLTDVSPAIPEWIRLVYHLTMLAVDWQTRTHAAGAESTGSGSTELPWSLGIVPMLLQLASERVSVGNGEVSQPLLAEALRLWLGHRGGWRQLSVHQLSTELYRWWKDTGAATDPFPIKLKRLGQSLETARQAIPHDQELLRAANRLAEEVNEDAQGGPN